MGAAIDNDEPLSAREARVWITVALCIALVLILGIFALMANSRNNAEVKIAKYTACAGIEDGNAALICVRGLGK